MTSPMHRVIRAVLAAYLLFACSPGEKTYTVETVDGVRHDITGLAGLPACPVFAAVPLLR